MNEHLREACIEALYIRYAPLLRKRCFHYVGGRCEYAGMIDDCVQETFLFALQKYETLRAHENPGGWLWQCCIHLLRNRLRREKRMLPLDGLRRPELPEPQDCIARWEARMQAREQLNAVYAALSERERRVCEVYFQKEFTLNETAEALGLSLSSVKSLLFRMRRRLNRQKKDWLVLLLLGAPFF